jgi:hypothetical protein
MRARTLITILAAASVAAVAGCQCSTDQRYQVPSPSHARSVTVAVQSCGATTGFITVVSVSQHWLGIVPVSRQLFVAEGELVGERDLALRWEGDDELVVTIRPGAILERRDRPFGGLVVRYEVSPKFGS